MTMTHGETFLAGMVAGTLLVGMIMLAYALAPRRPKPKGDSERKWMRAVEAAYDQGWENGFSGRLPKPVLRIERVGPGRRWSGTTRPAVALTSDNGEGAA